MSIKIKLVSVVDPGNVYLEEGLEARIGFLFRVGLVFFMMDKSNSKESIN